MTLMPKEREYSVADYLLYFVILFAILIVMYLHMLIKNFFYKRARSKGINL